MGYYARKSLENAMSGKIDIETDLRAVMEMQGLTLGDPELAEHNASHHLHPDPSCGYCADKLDEAREVIREQEDRWGEEREVVNV